MDMYEKIMNAARHYCNEKYIYWRERCAALKSETPADSDSDPVYDLITRYQMLNAVRKRIETFVGTRYQSTAHCLMDLCSAASAADSFTFDIKHPVGLVAVEEERTKYLDFLKDIEQNGIADYETASLPHRRMLTAVQTLEIDIKLRNRWNYNRGGWDPIDLKCPEECLFLMGRYLGNHLDLIKKVLEELASGNYILKFTENWECYEIEPSLLDFRGEEFAYFDHNLEWLCYYSFESTFTFAGKTCISLVKERLKDLEQHFNVYKEWYETD